eukprot:TRINITY_DN6070_c0_g2_i1.p1 TRINITY_DN6070_c0_g2~~TRINITY_DN6070_c0_g2_i1.p1  ORF type:complete len:1111 (+),score=163.52 TRINITY_DN6070_c0_g2_i1:56-3388(+)
MNDNSVEDEEVIQHDSALVVVDWYRCKFRPSANEDGTPDSSQEKIHASQRLMEHFELSLNCRTRLSVILFGSMYGFSHLCILAVEFALVLTPNRAGLDWPVYTLRAGIVALCFAVVVSPQFRWWWEPRSTYRQVFRILLLLKSLALCAVQLMQEEPSYGYIVFNQAFIYTFIPMHPMANGVIAFATLALYCFVGMYYLDLDERNPLIAVGLLSLQALAHARRYNWMLQGHLQMCNMKHQKSLQAKEEKDCDQLLRSMLPGSILQKLQKGVDIAPERFDNVTVIFAEICDFSNITQNSSASEVVVILNMVFSALDSITDKWSVHKVETVCQVYMAVAGCPVRSPHHAANAANTALDILDCVKKIGEGSAERLSIFDREQSNRCKQVMEILDGHELQIRIGLHSGTIRAGVIGIRNTRFKLFGDTVNTASRMESTCARQRVQVSATTADLLRNQTAWRFELESRGEIDIKGKGKMHTYYLLSSSSDPAARSKPPQVVHSELDEAEQVEIQLAQRAPSSPHAVDKKSSINAEEVMFGLTKLRGDMRPERATASMPLAISHKTEEDPQRTTGTGMTKLGLCLLNLRRITLRATTDNLVTRETLMTLDRDHAEYSKGNNHKWLKSLQGKGYLVILLFAFLEWMDYWTYLARGEWNSAIHLSVTLRNGVMVPLTVTLLCCTNMPGLLKAYYLNYVILVLILTIGILVVHSAYTVYVGDSGYFLSFLLLLLDVAVLPLRWRIGFSLIMIVCFALLQLVARSGESHSTISFLVFIYGCFCLAVHGQEHFTHLSDFKLRALQKQNERLKQVQGVKWHLLTDFLPPEIARRILEDSSADIVAESYDNVTILFTDMKGFTVFSSKLDPAELASFLNAMYSAFDEILERFGLHKVEVIGDAYFVVSGAPDTEDNRKRNPGEQAAFAGEAALAMINVLGHICDDTSVCIRVGLHSGSAVGGVVGRKDPRFHLFGHTVELANRMEEYSEPNKVHLSADTHALMTGLADQWRRQGDDVFTFEDRGLMDIPSAAEPLHTYFLLRSTFCRHYLMKQRRQQRQQASNGGTESGSMGLTPGTYPMSMRLRALHEAGNDAPLLDAVVPSDANDLSIHLPAGRLDEYVKLE